MSKIIGRVALLAAVGAATLGAQTPVQDTTLARRLERLQRQVDSLRRVAERQDIRLMELDERGAAAPVRTATGDTVGKRSVVASRGIYAKPFVRRFGAGTAVGGYVDAQYRHDLTNGFGAFDQTRMVPFIFSEITDRLHFGTEIEFEHGTKLEVEDGAAEGEGELNVEFATLDYRIFEGLNVRGGLILSPLGRFNLLHDSPVNDLTDRPLVARQVIPGTLTEAGVGFFGTLYPTESSLLTYEAYVVNGFTDELLPPAGDTRLRIRDAAGTRGAADAAEKNFVGRLAVSPFLGLEIGGSVHWGPYGDGVTDNTEQHDATIFAVDGAFQRGPFELIGEWARLRADLPSALAAAGVSDGREGFYLQGSFHFGHGWIVPKPTSVFTAVARWDQIDQAAGITGDQQRRFTAGLNWRPVEDAVIKSEYQWNYGTTVGSTEWHGAPRRLLFSLATYF